MQAKYDKGPIPNLFFLDEILYRKISHNRYSDEFKAFSMIDKEMQLLPYTYVLQNFQRAYTLDETSELVNRTRNTVFLNIYNGWIKGTHAVIWPVSGNPRPRGYRWSPNGVMKLRDAFAERQDAIERDPLSRGRNKYVPSRAEVRARLNNEKILYYRDEETGEFRPTWRA